MKKSLLAGLSASALCLLLLASPARAQDASVTSREGIALQNQILSLQNQVQQLQASVQQVQASGGGGGGNSQAPVDNGANGGLTAQLLQRVSTLEQQVRDLTGQLQQLQNQVNTQNAQLNKQIGDLSFQMQGGAGAAAGQAAGAAAGSAAAAAPSPDSPQAVAAPTPEALMQKGVLALHQGDFKTSEGVAREILVKFHKSPRAYDAQFLLAQSLQGQKRYQEAALAFDDTYNMNHKGSKAPSALLGLATTLGAINQKAAACDTLKTLNAQFPKPPGYLVQPIATQHKRLGC
ncbi:tetratricopeptide repeat protein [Acidisoma sp. 7E03]